MRIPLFENKEYTAPAGSPRRRSSPSSPIFSLQWDKMGTAAAASQSSQQARNLFSCPFQIHHPPPPGAKKIGSGSQQPEPSLQMGGFKLNSEPTKSPLLSLHSLSRVGLLGVSQSPPEFPLIIPYLQQG